MGRSRYHFFENEAPYFLTCTVVKWLPLFSSKAIVQIIIDSLTFLQETQRLIVYAYVIMENHLHLIASSQNISKEVGDFKRYTARKIIDHLTEHNAEHILKLLAYYKLKHRQDRDYQLWQEGSHPEQIQSIDMMQEKINYIHMNPVKRGYVDEAIHWRYSSARNYAGLESVIKITLFEL
jgi:putative transposase